VNLPSVFDISVSDSSDYIVSEIDNFLLGNVISLCIGVHGSMEAFCVIGCSANPKFVSIPQHLFCKICWLFAPG
jgi:hypothetical protein